MGDLTARRHAAGKTNSTSNPPSGNVARCRARSHLLRQAVHEREPEAGALAAPRQLALAAVEGLEQLAQMVPSDARTVVAHRQVDLAAIAADS